MKRVGLLCQVSAFDPCLFFVFRETRRPAGAFTTHIDDILGRGGPDVLPKIRDFSGRRFGELKLPDAAFVDVGMELEHDSDFSATLTRDEFAQNS